MTPEEKAAALAEAKGRGLPDGWRVELDVRPSSIGILDTCKVFRYQILNSLCYLFLAFRQFRQIADFYTNRQLVNFDADKNRLKSRIYFHRNEWLLPLYPWIHYDSTMR